MVSENTLTLQPREVLNLPLFGIILEGDALSPSHADGDILVIARQVYPSAGDLVMIEIKGKFGVMKMNADGDMFDNTGGFAAQGTYRVVGVVIDHQPRQMQQVQ